VLAVESDYPADTKNNFALRKQATVYTYIGDAHREIAASANGPEWQAHRRAAKENYQRSLDIFLLLQSQNYLAEADRKYLQEPQAGVQKMSRN
jgi:hypothetical protein